MQKLPWRCWSGSAKHWVVWIRNYAFLQTLEPWIYMNFPQHRWKSKLIGTGHTQPVKLCAWLQETSHSSILWCHTLQTLPKQNKRQNKKLFQQTMAIIFKVDLITSIWYFCSSIHFCRSIHGDHKSIRSRCSGIHWYHISWPVCCQSRWFKELTHIIYEWNAIAGTTLC